MNEPEICKSCVWFRQGYGPDCFGLDDDPSSCKLQLFLPVKKQTCKRFKQSIHRPKYIAKADGQHL